MTDRLKRLLKQTMRSAGVDVSKRDRLAEQIPAGYLRSSILPPIYRDSLARLLYFREMFERVRPIPGDIVECGVSIGTGILNWALLAELSSADRQIVGYDSFAGFPASSEHDRKADGSFHSDAGYYSSPPELVLRILREGRVSAAFVRDRVRLVRGFFDRTLHRHDRPIALLHLDCDLYESYRTCLTTLYDKVAPGGLILFDEYSDAAFPGAKQAVDEFFADRTERPMRYFEYGYEKYYTLKA